MKYYIQGRKKEQPSTNDKAALNVILHDCTKTRDFSRELYGDSIFPRKLKAVYQGGRQSGIRADLSGIPVLGHAPQTFRREVSKKVWQQSTSGWRDTAPPKLSHGSASAPLAPADVKIPDSLYQFGHGKPGITLFKTLPVLEPEDDAEVLCLHAVIQEAVIAYFLEAMGKDMHQAAPDEFRVVQGDQPFWLSRLPASGGKSNLILRNRKDTSVGDGDSVGIASQIFDGIAKTVEGLLDII